MTYAYGQEDDLGIGSAHTDEIESLRQQLAECQARGKALREAIQYIAEWGAADASDASDDNYSYAENILKSVPFDSTALDAMLKQAKQMDRDAKPQTIDVEPDAWATKTMCIGENYGKTHYGKLPIQSMQPGFYSHEKLYSEKTVIGLMKSAYYDGYTDREIEFREAKCHELTGRMAEELK